MSSIGKIKNSSISNQKISALSDRPNDDFASGGNNLTAAELKAHFDALPETLKNKINDIIDDITIVSNGNSYSMQDALANGVFAKVILAYENESEMIGGNAKTLQAILYGIAEKLGTPSSSVAGAVKIDDVTVKVNGSEQLYVPTATNAAKGVVKPDNSTINVNGNGVISVPTATASLKGVSKPDNSTIVAQDGVLKAVKATAVSEGIVKPDGTTIEISNGTISVPTATSSAKGIVKPDNSTINVDGNGVVSVPTATSSAKGVVKPDGTTITIDRNGVISARISLFHVCSSGEIGTGENGYDIPDVQNPSENIIYLVPITDVNGDACYAEYLYWAETTPTAGDAIHWELLGILNTPHLGLADTTTLGLVKIDGETVLLNSSSQLYVPSASSSQKGIVKIDDTTVKTNGSDQLYAATATSSAKGIVKPDGTTITIDGNGVISAVTASGGAGSAPTATASTLGVVKPDGTTITIDGNGVISARANLFYVCSDAEITVGASGYDIPDVQTPSRNLIYLVPQTDMNGDTYYNEFLYWAETTPTDGDVIHWELLGILNFPYLGAADSFYYGLVKIDGESLSCNSSGQLQVNEVAKYVTVEYGSLSVVTQNNTLYRLTDWATSISFSAVTPTSGYLRNFGIQINTTGPFNITLAGTFEQIIDTDYITVTVSGSGNNAYTTLSLSSESNSYYDITVVGNRLYATFLGEVPV